MITDETLGFDAHQAIESWANVTPSSSAIGFSPFTFRSVSSTRDLFARFWKVETQGKEWISYKILGTNNNKIKIC